MNKKVLIALVIAGVAAVGVVAYFVISATKPMEQTTNSSQDASTRFAAVKACELFTLAEAKQLMGEAASEGSNTAPSSSSDVNVDTCSYTNNATSVPAIRTATLMVRSALTDDGMDSNRAAFEPGGAANPADATAVSGYGEKAFWDQTTRQLAILKDNTWIGIVYGGTNPANSTLDDAKKVADLVAK